MALTTSSSKKLRRQILGMHGSLQKTRGREGEREGGREGGKERERERERDPGSMECTLHTADSPFALLAVLRNDLVARARSHTHTLFVSFPLSLSDTHTGQLCVSLSYSLSLFLSLSHLRTSSRRSTPVSGAPRRRRMDPRYCTSVASCRAAAPGRAASQRRPKLGYDSDDSDTTRMRR